MKQALEALEKSVATCFHEYAHEQVMSFPEHFINQTITALRAAIEQGEKQKPCIAVSNGKITIDARNGNLSIGAPRQWVGLTPKDLAEIPPSAYEGAIWADAKLKEKNDVLRSV